MSQLSTTIRVFHPNVQDGIVVRTAANWDADVTPTHVDTHLSFAMFDVAAHEPYLEYKPCLRRDANFHWAGGANKLALMTDEPNDIYPTFFSAPRGQLSGVIELASPVLGRGIRLRAYLPPGYDENVQKRYPVLYMLDGQNLFFPEEAFLGQDWAVDETLDRLDEMNAIDSMIVIGIHSNDRLHDFTEPGIATYGRALVEDVKRKIDAHLRTLSDARRTGVIGSSLGGVAAFHVAWNWPHVFGRASCLSSTFGYGDSLVSRVRSEGRAGREDLRFYLDSGWPADNYEATLAMAAALIEAGFELGKDVLHLAFPLARHDERAWSSRVHVPLQLFSGKLRRLADHLALQPV